MYKVVKNFSAFLLILGLVALIELCLLAEFCCYVSLDSILFHLRYYKTILSVSWPFFACVFLGGWTVFCGTVIFCLWRKITNSAGRKLFFAAYVPVLLWLGWRLDVFSHIRLSGEEDVFYRRFYHHPVAEFQSSARPNLIMLFLESLEAGFMRGQTPEYNLLPELSRRLQYGNSFEGYTQTAGTWWTMGAMVGAWCGIPLSLPLKENFIYSDEYFLPGTVCIPDILAGNGYKLFYIKGSSSQFAGLDIFLRSHRFAEADIIDNRRLLGTLPAEEIGAWGFADTGVYREFKRRIIKLSQSGSPFFAVMSTIDTHIPFNKLPPQCAGSNSHFADAFKCADKQAAEFIDWFLRQPFAENTVLVVLGDHLFMEKYWNGEFFPENSRRTVFNLFINSRVRPLGGIGRRFTPLDMFPSLLESLGMRVSDHRAGLGVSVFAPRSHQTLLEQMGIKRLNDSLNGKSGFYKGFLN